MKKLLCFATVLLILSSCNDKQFFISSSEIDIVKKANEAYFKGDWEAFKSLYNEKARIWVNAPRLKDTRITPDQLVDLLKADIEKYTEYKMGQNPDYEDPGYSMIIDDEGGKWVTNWITWLGKTRNGKEVITPVFHSYHFKENKIEIHFIYFNALPGYLATQESDSTGHTGDRKTVR